MVKTARTFSLPLLTFCDTPGIMTTQEEEHKGLLTETTVYISELMENQVPTVCVTLGKGIGMGYFIMGCSDPEAITFSWPTTQIAYLGPEGGAAVVHRKELAAIEPDRPSPQARRTGRALPPQHEPLARRADGHDRQHH